MVKPQIPRPTDAELSILRVIWRLGPSTVREIHDEIQQSQQVGYTTVLKLLQIMTEKGLVRRDASERAHVYEAASDREDTQKQLVGDLLDKAFGGSALSLVLSALSSRRAAPEEIAEVRELLERLEKEKSR